MNEELQKQLIEASEQLEGCEGMESSPYALFNTVPPVTGGLYVDFREDRDMQLTQK